MSSRHVALGCAMVLFALVSSCHRTESEEALRAEASRLTHAIEVLRAAPAGHRDVQLAALASLTCSDPDACHVRSTCVEAYELEAKAWVGIERVRLAVRGDAGAGAGSVLTSAGEDLRRSRTLANQCADLEGALRRQRGIR